MTWLSLLSVVLKLASAIANTIREKKLMDAGAAKETARQLGEIATRAGIADNLRAEVAALTDSDLDASLQGDDP